jgi:hypothetical protein
MTTKVLAILTLAVLAASCAGNAPVTPTPPPPPATETQPAAPSASAPTSTPDATPLPPTDAPGPTPTSPTPAPLPVEGRSYPQYAHIDFTPLDNLPGQYQTPAWFSIPFTFEASQPFGGIGEVTLRGELFALTKGAWNWASFFAIDSEISYEETVALLRETPNFEISPSRPVQIMGTTGTQIDMGSSGGLVPAIATLVGHPVEAYSHNWLIIPGHQLRYVVLETGDRVLLVEFDARESEFDAFVAEIEEILETIEFLPGTP